MFQKNPFLISCCSIICNFYLHFKGKASTAGLERAGEVEVSVRWQFCEAPSDEHITLHADALQSSITDPFEETQNERGEPGSSSSAASQA